MKLLMDSNSVRETNEATAALAERLRYNPQAVQLLNDILELWMDKGAKEDFDHFISDLMLEAEMQEVSVHPQTYLPVRQNLFH